MTESDFRHRAHPHPPGGANRGANVSRDELSTAAGFSDSLLGIVHRPAASTSAYFLDRLLAVPNVEIVARQQVVELDGGDRRGTMPIRADRD